MRKRAAFAVAALGSVAPAFASELTLEAPSERLAIEALEDVSTVIDASGALFGNFTERWIGETVVLKVCDKELMRPLIMDRIDGGQVHVTGRFSEEIDQIAGALTGRQTCDDLTLP